ncbi:MAG: MmgE/PrpD family protein [Deltaproteobacteria bacterium]|uniref:MmgE/PrpD family protein n=1 Tax=Candidatus Zymogenus saltonus TaxID=2844893 RepID=A0A9D8PN21_9DELT|nr:MmgE/PrpD family protein [Candidatus Zymogenus saltonus]
MEYSKALSDFCARLTYGDIPDDVAHKAKLCILDYLANVYGSLKLDAVKGVASYIKSLNGPNEATCVGLRFKSGIHNAAFINGTAAEAIESQDGLRFGGNHPGTAVIPAAFAVAERLSEKRKVGGKEVITAIVAGYEAADRPAAAMHPRHTLSGFLPTGTTGTFGAAVAAAKLMGLDPEKMSNALGNAGYILPVSMAEQLMGGYTVKIVQGGQAASAGITAAFLSYAGITGMPSVFEGTQLGGGFCKITTDFDPAYERITDRLGEHYTIMDIYFKPYTACRHTHGAAQATLELKAEREFGPKDVEEVKVFTYGIGVIAVGKGVKENDSIVNAQFSIPYVVSVTIADNDLGPEQLTEKRLADRSLIDFTKKVKVDYDDEINKMYPEKTASRVEITLKGGEVIKKQVEIPKGDPRDPMEADDLAAKIKRFAPERNEADLDKLIEATLKLESVSDIREITRLME